MPGCKTDVKNAEWIAQLVRHGLGAIRALAVAPDGAVAVLDVERGPSP